MEKLCGKLNLHKIKAENIAKSEKMPLFYLVFDVYKSDLCSSPVEKSVEKRWGLAAFVASGKPSHLQKGSEIHKITQKPNSSTKKEKHV